MTFWLRLPLLRNIDESSRQVSAANTPDVR